MSGARPKLYVLPGSHPCAAVEAALAIKSIAYDSVVLLPILPVVVGRLRYGGTTVPGMSLDGERIVGSRAIMRRLDELAPQPPLLPPAAGAEHAKVLDAERWGDEVFQNVPRRILDVCFLRRPRAMESYAAGAKLPLSPAMMRPAMPLTARLMALKNKASEASARADIAALPAQLERIDGWIAEGLLGGERPNAADLQIGSTVRLLTTIGDVCALVESHPAAALTRYFPPTIGEIEPGVLPAGWSAQAAAA